MADRSGLKFVGFIFATVTLAVMLTTGMIVQGYADGGKDKSCFGLECDLYWKQLNGACAAPPGDAPARARFCNCSTE